MNDSRFFLPTLLASVLAVAGCKNDPAPAGNQDGSAKPTAKAEIIKIDGSSTVFPVTEAVAEEFQRKTKLRVTIGVSGTGGGFKKFCAGEIAISGASRTIKDTEKALCEKGGVKYVELAVAYDGISVVVNPKNDFVDHLTVAELKTMWEPGAQNKVKTWKQVRDSFPDKPITLFGPGVDSGTFDYFTKKVVGKAQASRGDYTASEDDNVLVHGVSTNENALGFFGFAYFIENQKKLKAVPIKASADADAIKPSLETISSGSYKPLSRPIFIYVSEKAAKRPEVTAFIDFYLDEGKKLAEEVGYIGLPPKAFKASKAAFATVRAKK